MAIIHLARPLSSQLLTDHRDDRALEHCFNVMLDVDSIIFPLLDAMATRPGGQRIAYAECETWFGLPNLIDGGLQRMLTMFDECFAYDVMRNHAPFGGAVESVRALAGLGVRFHVKTERNARFAADTKRYLADHGIEYVSFACDQPFDKVADCQSQRIAVAVDDNPKFIAAAHAAGIDVTSLLHRYNADVLAEHDLNSAATWPQLALHIIAAVETRLLTELADRA